MSRTRRERLASASLYLVMPPEVGSDLDEFIRAVLSAGVDIIQLRDKTNDRDRTLRAAEVLRSNCDRYDALFIVNDHCDLAIEAGADGVHLGQDDLDVAEARRRVGADLVIGWSTHSETQIRAAEEGPVDYLGVGPVFATPTKPKRPAVGTQLVEFASTTCLKPFFAIGGIGPTVVTEVVSAGATRIAVVRAIVAAPDPAGAARVLKQALVAQEGQSGPTGFRTNG